MSDKLSWSLTTGSANGSLDDSGSFSSEAVTVASISVAAASNASLGLQLANVTNIALLAIKASSYNGKVKVKGPSEGATEITLSGPLVLFGKAVSLFDNSLSSLTVTNDDQTNEVDIEILLARQLTV